MTDVSPDGAWALATIWEQETGTPRLWMISLRGSGAPRPFAAGAAAAAGGFSPDGQWITYVVDPTGHPQLHIAHFPDGRYDTQLDTEWAFTAQWLNAGELLITGPRGQRILPLTRDGNAWTAGTIRNVRLERRGVRLSATNDGKRFLDLVTDPAAPSRRRW